MRHTPATDVLLDKCDDLQIACKVVSANGTRIVALGPSDERVTIDLSRSPLSLFEQFLRGLRIDFEKLPTLALGDSKEIRLLSPKLSLSRLIPTVYSYTKNRYGVAPGSEVVRARFTAELFRALQCRPGSYHIATAFLGSVDVRGVPLLAERVVQPSNLEVRVKRYHIGSPVHRYLYTHVHPTAHNGPPLVRWSRFGQPLVCFDWRHPLRDDGGNRLADEPLSDDYAGIWVDDVRAAKALCRELFLWIEELFLQRGVRLIDICFFVEISPDCMRVRSNAADESDAFDKDEWRSGGSAAELVKRYSKLYEIVFGPVVANWPQ
jgi:phosphoribosylaminoimidazole-succinocarboxamide synthase